MGTPRISVILPTCEGRKDLEALLPVLIDQEVEGGHEVLVVDSASRDGSAELCEAAGASVTRIEREDFRHGATRNLRAHDARGEYLVFLTQDALPQGSDFLQKLVSPLTNSNVVGAWARILPRPSDDPLTRRTALAQPEASHSGFAIRGDGVWTQSSMAERLARVRFNNVASAVRRDYFESHVFEDVAFGEDLAWAISALDDGRELCFNPNAVVFHAHRYSLAESFERNRVDSAFQRVRFGRQVRRGLVSVLRGLAHETLADVRFILWRERAGVLHLCRSPFLRGAQVLGQLFGSRGWNLSGGEEATRKFN